MFHRKAQLVKCTHARAARAENPVLLPALDLRGRDPRPVPEMSALRECDSSVLRSVKKKVSRPHQLSALRRATRCRNRLGLLESPRPLAESIVLRRCSMGLERAPSHLARSFRGRRSPRHQSRSFKAWPSLWILARSRVRGEGREAACCRSAANPLLAEEE